MHTLSDFHTELRNKTSEHHKRLERLPASVKMLAEDLTRSEYSFYLTSLYKMHRSVEEVVFPMVSGIFSQIEARKKTHLITDDLIFLDPSQKAPTTEPDSKHLSVAFGVGMCYVTEGSTLGSVTLLKNISRALNLHEGKGTQFLNCYGQNTGSMWKKFVQEMEAYSAKSADAEKEMIVDGANFAFGKIYDLLNENK